LVTAKYNSKQQIQITHGKLQTLTVKTKTIIAIQNSSRQEQNTHGKSKTVTAKAKHSRQIKSRIVVSGCPSKWCRASQSIFLGLFSIMSILDVQKLVLLQLWT